MADTELLVKKARKGMLKMRPVLPLGQPVSLGDVGFLDGDAFRYVGTVMSVLGAPVGKPIPGEAGQEFFEIFSGRDVSASVLGKGDTSEVFGAFAKASVRIELSLELEKSFAIVGQDLRISTLEDPIRLIPFIQRDHDSGSWRKEYCFVYQIGVARSYSGFLSQQSGAKVLLRASGNLAAGPVPVGSVGAGVKFARQSGSVEKVVAAHDAICFFNAYKLKDGIFRGPRLQTAAAEDVTPVEIKKELKIAGSPFEIV